MNHVYIVTHTDLDGVASAAVAVRLLGRIDGGYTVSYAEPYNLDEVLAGLEQYIEEGDLLVVSDLGPNRSSFPRAVEVIKKLAGRRVDIEWYDHHVWSDDDKKALAGAGVKLFIDTSTCAAGVVARYMPSIHDARVDEYIEDLVAATCSADLWRWDHPLSPKLFRVVGRNGEGQDGKDLVLKKLISGILWDEELEERLLDYLEKELEGFNNVQRTTYIYQGHGCRVAAAYKQGGPPANSFIGGMLLGRYSADIAVIIRPNGGISLRSRRVNVQRIASSLGGGVHPRASGAKVDIPLIYMIRSRIYPRMVSRYIARIVAREAGRLGSCTGPV